MSGGLMQIIAYGAQDVYLSGESNIDDINPEIIINDIILISLKK